jgi:hypothetical protein
VFSFIGEAQGQSLYLLWDTAKKHKDSLLIWYGERKNGTFYTASGSAINFDPKTGAVKASFLQGTDPMQPVFDELNNTGKAEQELMKEYKDAGNDMKTYPIVQEAVEFYEKLKEETKDVILKEIDWGENDEFIGKKKFGPEGFKNFMQNDFCVKEKPVYDDILAYAAKVKAKDGAHDYDLPPPPSADYFNCWGCNKRKRDLYDTLVKRYESTYLDDGSPKRIKNAMGLVRDLTVLLGEDANHNINFTEDIVGTSSRHPTACTYLEGINDKMMEAVYTIMQYEKDRSWALFKKYQKDVTTIVPVQRVCLIVERNCQLMGYTRGEDLLLPEINAVIYKLIEKWSALLIKDNDYSKIADIPFILGTIRSYEQLGGKDENIVDKTVTALVTFNRFKIFVDFDIDVGEKYSVTTKFHSEAYLNAVPKTEEEQADTNNKKPCLRWVPAGTQGGDKNMFLPFTLTEVNWNGPLYSYIGPRQFYSTFDMHTYLCDDPDKPDSLFLSGNFRSEPAGAYLWQASGQKTRSGPLGPMGFGAALFVDPQKAGNEMIKEYQSGEMMKKVQNIQSQSQAQLAMAMKIKEMQKSGASYQQIAAQLSKTMQQGNDVRAEMSSTFLGATIPFTIKFENKNKTPVNGAQNTFDARQLNQSEARVIIRGIMSVTIRHDPYKDFEDYFNSTH